jgi:hypothetical protein
VDRTHPVQVLWDVDRTHPVQVLKSILMYNSTPSLQ